MNTGRVKVFCRLGVAIYCVLSILLVSLGGGQLALAQRVVEGQVDGPSSPQASLRYVAKNGTDAGPNDCLNPAAPCLTIGQAISVAQLEDMIQVAQGVYLENINIDKQIYLQGGFQQGTWVRDVGLYETIIDGSNSREVPGDWDGDSTGLAAVIAVPGGYRMWYDGKNAIYGWQLGMADSPDGINWTKYANNPVLSPAGGSEWDSWYRGQVAILFEDGVYKMWYSGAGDDWQTGYATSLDGITWSIHPGNPVLPTSPDGSWDSAESDGPTVIHDGDIYKMWYHGCNDDWSICNIGYATSPDGIAWTKYAGNPVLTVDQNSWDRDFIGWPRVIKNGSSYEMWYSSNSQIGRATSTDGVNWIKTGSSSVIVDDGQGNPVSGGSVVFDGSAYKMWLRVGPNWDRRIMLATSPDGINWSIDPNQPGLKPGTPTLWGESTVSVHWTTGPAKLDGFTITGAEACREGAGGVSIDNAIAEITNSIIRNNSTADGCGGGGIGAMGSSANLTLAFSTVIQNNGNDGGGVMSWDGAHIYMHHSIVRQNHAYGWGGGGVEVMQNGASLIIEDSNFEENTTAGEGGGGVYAKEFSQFTISNSTITDNQADGQGGGMLIINGHATVDGLQILNNSAIGDGGGVSVEGDASAEISHTVIKANHSEAQGGGLAVKGDTTLRDSMLLENTANGGAGGISVFHPDGGGQLIAENTVIAHNQGTWGGAIAPFWRGSLTNVTVANNTSTESANAGVEGAQDNLDSPHKVVNSIVYLNDPGGFACYGQCDVSYSDLQGGWPGTGNIDVPPMFTNSTGQDYSLTGESTCIDAGTPAGAPDHDLLGNPRPVNLGFDMGAHEYQGPHGLGPVVLRLEPANGTFYTPGSLQFKIQVDAGAQLVDGAAAYLDFDPAVLQVAGITPGAALNVLLQNEYDNAAGTINYAAGALAGIPSGTFTLATVSISLVGTAPETTISFNHLMPRQSDATYGGNSVLDHYEKATLIVRNDSIVNGFVGLQGRPAAPNSRWVTPLELTLTRLGELDLSYILNTTTDTSGNFTIDGILPGDYTVRVKNSHTLANTKTASLVLGPNTLSLGMLREGDANNDNCVLLGDFSILATTFSKGSGAPGYDDRADFNEDNWVTIQDFSLLASNYGVCGDLPSAPAPALAPAPDAWLAPSRPAADVIIMIDPATSMIEVGDTFTVSVVIEAGAQPLDGAEADLNFDPTALKVTKVSGNGIAFPLELKNSYNNSLGSVDYAAGTFTNFPTGRIVLVTIQFQALKEIAQTSLDFVFEKPRLTDVTYGSVSILSDHTDGLVSIEAGSFDIFLPVVRR